MTTARQTCATSVASAIVSAETGGVSNLAGAPALPGNLSSWSHASAVAALNAGQITQSQFVGIMTRLADWAQSQISLAKDVLKNSGDTAPA